MENSTIKPRMVKKPVPKTDKVMERVVELSERMNHLVKILQDHSNELGDIKGKLKQVRTRMGL